MGPGARGKAPRDPNKLHWLNGAHQGKLWLPLFSIGNHTHATRWVEAIISDFHREGVICTIDPCSYPFIQINDVPTCDYKIWTNHSCNLPTLLFISNSVYPDLIANAQAYTIIYIHSMPFDPINHFFPNTAFTQLAIQRLLCFMLPWLLPKPSPSRPWACMTWPSPVRTITLSPILSTTFLQTYHTMQSPSPISLQTLHPWWIPHLTSHLCKHGAMSLDHLPSVKGKLSLEHYDSTISPWNESILFAINFPCSRRQ